MLTIPHAIVSSGMLLGPVLLTAMIYLCNVAKDWLLESLARAEVLLGNPPKAPGPLQLRRRVLEVTELAKVVCGDTFRNAYMTVVGLWTLGTLWSFAAVFSASLAAHIPVVFLAAPHNKPCNINELGDECKPQYLVFLAVFAIIVVPLTLMDMREQVAVQVIMAAGRVVLLVAMGATVVAAWACDGVAFAITAQEDGGPPPLFGTVANFGGLGVLIPISVTAAAFHQAIPSVTRATAKKRQMGSILTSAFIVVGTCYVVFGVLLALYFGHDVEAQATLMWQGYKGCAASADDEPSDFAKAITLFVLLFPAMDVASAFPLSGIALANNLLGLFYPTEEYEDEEVDEAEDEGGDEGTTGNATLSSAGAAAPPRPCTPDAPLVASTEAPDYGATSGGSTDGTAESASSTSASLLESDAAPAGGGGTDALDVAVPPAPAPEPANSQAPHWAHWAAKLAAALPPLVGAAIVTQLDRIVEVTGTLAVFMVYTAPAIMAYASHGAILRQGQHGEGVFWWAVTPPRTGVCCSGRRTRGKSYTQLTSPKPGDQSVNGKAPEAPSAPSKCTLAHRMFVLAACGSRGFENHPAQQEASAETLYSPMCAGATWKAIWAYVPGVVAVGSVGLWAIVLGLVVGSWSGGA